MRSVIQAVATAPTDPESIAALEEQRAAEDREYQRLKGELQTWCFGTAISCFAATLVFYSRVSLHSQCLICCNTCCLLQGDFARPSPALLQPFLSTLFYSRVSLHFRDVSLLSDSN